MRNGFRFQCLTLTGILTVALVFLHSEVDAQATTPTSSSTGGESLEEIVVTASKRSETIQNVPTALTALTSDTLQKLGINDFQDYLPYVPSLQMASAGAPGQGVMIIRGIYSGFEQTTSTVSYYIDEVPFSPSSAGFPSTLVMPDPDLADVQQVEVLKGPQSTLYGASALGGLIKIVTKKPDLEEYSGDVRLEGTSVDGGGNGGGVRASVNLPLVTDKLALRLAGFDRLDPGYVDNVQTGQSNVNSTRVDGGRATLRFDPTDRLEIDLDGFVQNLHSNGTAEQDLNPTTLQPLEGRYKYAAFFNSNSDTKYDIGNLTVSYRLDVGTITSATSYGHYGNDNSLDYTKIYGPLLGFTGPEAVLSQLFPAMDKTTEELRFNSNRIGPMEVQGGLFYTHERDTYTAILNGVDGLTGTPLPAPFGNIINAPSTDTYDEYAVYGDATWHFIEQADATVGVRQSYTHQDGETSSTGLLAGAAQGVVNQSRSTASDTSYLFTARWRPTDGLSTYIRAASAYRPGGPQFSPSPSVPSSFGPDTVWNYEVGAKGVGLDGRLSADADVYYLKWKDIQLNALVDGLTVTGNGGNAHSEGVEFAGQYKPIAQLVLGANAAYDHTRIDSISATSTAGAVVGDPLPNTPKWSGALTADYSVPVGRVTGKLGASYRYQGSTQSSFSGVNTDIDARIPSYSLVDLRTGLDWKHYSLIFRVNNVTNKYALSNIELLQLVPGDPADPVYGTGVPIQPRTYILSLDMHF
jgi:iron complex outermembrane recepter protein